MNARFAGKRLASLALVGALAWWSSREAVAQTTYYWDNTSPMSTTGFGTAGGTWGTDAFWSTSNTGVNASGTLTTGTADTANFGTNAASYGLASGTVGVNGTVNIGSIVSGSQSGAITLGSSVSSGTITLGAAGGSIRNNSGSVLTINSDIVITVSSPSYRDILGTGTVVLNGSTSGGGYWRVNSGATLVLKNSSSVGLGFNTGGTILVGASNLTWGALSVAGGGTLDLNGYDFTVGNMQWAAGTITDNSAGSGTTTLTNNGVNTITFGGLIADGASKKLAFAYNGSGLPLTLSNANTFSGNTKLVAGTLRLGNSLALQNSAIDTSGAGNISLAYATGTTTTPTIGGLIGSKNLSSVISGSYALMTALTLNTVSGQNLTYSGTIAEGAAGMTLTKSGVGTQTLSATNTYTGATTITAGQLQIGSAGSINTSSGITINGATAEFKYNAATALTKPITFTAGTLSGTGTIGTAVTVGSNDILSPGNSPGSQSFTQGLTFAPGGKFVWEINNWAGSAGTNYDQLVVSGSALNITATSGTTFTIALTSLTGSNTAGAVPGFSGTAGTSFTIATSSAGITGFDKGKFSIDTSAFTNNNTLPTNAGFWLSTSSTSLILNYAPSATYTLSAAASAAAIRVGGTSTITATVTSSTASVTNPDSLSYTGLALSGGLGTLSSTSGTLAGGATSSGSAAFTTLGTGSYTFNPSLTSATNVNIGTSANPGTTSGVTVTVYNPAAPNTLSAVSLGNIHAGSSFNPQSLSIWNTGTAAASFQEGLAGSYTSATGAASGSGSFGNLFASSTSTAISVGLGSASTATGGVKSGTVTLGFTSTGTTSTGATGLNPLPLASQAVAVTGTVWNYAAANNLTTPISLGNVYVGGTFGTSALTVSNTAPSTFSEGLNASFGSKSGIISNNGLSITNLIGGGTDTTLTVGLGGSANTGSAAALSGTQAITLVSNGANSGLGNTNLDSQTLTITGTVWNPAAVNSLSPVTLGNVHVGGTFGTSALSIRNTAVSGSFTEVLGATGSSSGLASLTGSVAGLAGGGTSTGISVGLGGSSNTATAGAKSGTAAISFTSTGGPGTALIAAQNVAVTGTVWNYAAATIASGTTINLGTVLKGTSLSQALSITNTAPNDGFSEKLDAAFGTPTGNATTSGGPTSLLASGSTSTALAVGLDSLTAGGKSGSVQVNFTSNGDGTSGLGTTSLAPQTVSLTATVLDPALASFMSGSTATTSLLLDFGSVQQNAIVSPLGFDLYNIMQTSGYTADLALLDILSGTGNTGAITTTLPGSFNNLAAGNSFAYTASFSTATLGSFQNVYTLRFKSANNSSAFAGDTTQNLTLTVQGVIVVPEPGALALAGIGTGLATWLARRRRQGL